MMRYLLLLCLLIAACGADDPAASPEPTSTPDDRADTLARYMERNFRDTSWWGDVEEFDVDGATLTVDTALGNSDAAKAVASLICSASSSYIYAASNQSLDLDRVRVMASSGQPLIVRNGASDSC